MSDIVSYRMKQRKRVADALREARRDGLKISKGLLALTRRHYGVEAKPTADNLWMEALSNLRFSQTPVRQMGNEYYSMCGAEDAAGERRDQARKHAKVCYLAAKRLNPFVITIPELEDDNR